MFSSRLIRQSRKGSFPSQFFNFSGKLYVSVLFIKVVVKFVNFVYVYGSTKNTNLKQWVDGVGQAVVDGNILVNETLSLVMSYEETCIHVHITLVSTTCSPN